MNKLTVNNERMGQFIDTITAQVGEILTERSDDILKAWAETIDEAVSDEADFPKLKVAFGSVVDLEASKIETSIRFTVAYKSSVSTEIPDPNQPDLPGIKGASVTISTGDIGVEISNGKIKTKKGGGK